MKLPWDASEKKERISELEERVEKLQKQKQSLEERYRAEKQRRSEESRDKQEAQKKLKKANKKIKTLKDLNSTEISNKKPDKTFSNLGVEKVIQILTKLEQIQSNEKEMLSVYSRNSLESIENFRELKNSVPNQYIRTLENKDRFIAFKDHYTIGVVIKSRPFFKQSWKLAKEFNTSKLKDFISKEKTWVVVSAGESRIIKERKGEVVEKKELESRVDRQHRKGGYSQQRFERKREEQVENHIGNLKSEIDEDHFYVVGEERLAKELDGEYLGGIDHERSIVDALYGFQLVH